MEFILILPISVLFLIISALHVVYRKPWSIRPLQRLPPSPPGWPMIGHLHLLSNMPHHALAELAMAMRAPLLRLQLGTVRAVVISSPDLARAALTTGDAALASRPHLLGGAFLAFGCSDVTFSPAGPYHRATRRLVVSELLSPRRVATYHRIRANEVRRLLGRLAEIASSSPAAALPPVVVDISECFVNLANDVLFRVAFGRGFPRENAAKLGAVFAEANELFAGFTMGDYFPELEPVVSTVTGLRRRLKNCLAHLCEFCDDIIDELISGKREHVSGQGEEDFIDVLLRVQKSPDLEVPLTVDNIKALVLDVFVAGSDTSLAALEWVMTELVRHPGILKKAQDEVRQVVGDRGRVEESKLHELHYLHAIIKETFRLHPVIPLLVPRESVAPCTLGGFHIPAKTRVFINTYAMGRDPEIWDKPLKFRPERFENDEREIDLIDPNFKVLPFGGGRRGCPGYAFALATLQLSLASLLYHFDWTLPPGMRAEDVNMDEIFGLSTRKKEPLFVVIKKHEEYEFKRGEIYEF